MTNQLSDFSDTTGVGATAPCSSLVKGSKDLSIILNPTANLDTLPSPALSPKACILRYAVKGCGCGRYIVPSTCMSLDCIVCQRWVTKRRAESVFDRLTGYKLFSNSYRTFKPVIYTVFTVPISARERFYDRKEWQKVRIKMWRVLKAKFGALYGVEATHPVGGDDIKLFHPHLNFLWVQQQGWSPFVDVNSLRDEWAKILEVDAVDVYTQYAGNPAMVKHWCKYVCRSFPGLHSWIGSLRWYGKYPKKKKLPPGVCPDCGQRYKLIGWIDAQTVDTYNKTGWTLGLAPPWEDDEKIIHVRKKRAEGVGSSLYQ